MKEYKRILLVSDTHFSLGCSRASQEEFIRFVYKEMERNDALFLLGDIFDFYYEYRYVIPKDFFFIYELFARLKEKGKDIHYWTGNHDFWHGDFLKSIGVAVHPGKTFMEISGKRFMFAHGDDTGKFNPVNFIIRNDLTRLFYSYIHPDIGFDIARIVSRLSRASSKRKKPRIRKYLEFARKGFAEGADFVVIGHIHEQLMIKEGEKAFIILGDWMEHKYYGLIEEGSISLKRWNQSPV